MNKKVVLYIVFLLTGGFISNTLAQNTVITDDDSYPVEPSAMLDVKSLSKGFLVPRMSETQRMAISNPADGLLVYDTTVEGFFFYKTGTWTQLSSGQIWETNGTQVFLSDPNDNVGVGISNPGSKMLVKADATNGVNEAIFAVQNNDGDTVFAVYPEGVRIWVNDDGGSKAVGSRGGFAVGGFSPAKAGFTNEYLRVTPDSVRVYINDDFTGSKAVGSRGGFAVGGFSPAKGSNTDDYLFIQDDSTRVYVAGSEGFAVDNIEVGSEGRYMDLTPENYLIGHLAGSQITTGLYNSFLGYEAGYSNQIGSDNVFLGFQAGYNNIGATGWQGSDNIFIGNKAGYNNIGITYGYRNIFFGNEAGFLNDEGAGNVYIGYYSGHNATDGMNNVCLGNYAGESVGTGNNNVYIGEESGRNCLNEGSNVFIGESSGDNATGGGNTYIGKDAGGNAHGYSNTSIGYMAGLCATTSTSVDYNTSIGRGAGKWLNTGDNNIFIGFKAGQYLDDGEQNVIIGVEAGNGTGSGANNPGSGNIFIGYRAGYYETGSNRLYIDNSSTSDPLIYGEFDTDRLGINEDVPSANLHIKQVGTGEEALAIENDGDSDTWSWEVGGNDLQLFFNGTYIGYWDDATGNYTGTSDKRLKKDIITLNESVLTKINQLEVVSYRLLHADEKSQKIIGFIAQDVQKLLPDLVRQREDGYLSLNYDDFGVIAIKAIQEQQKIIDELLERIKKLEEKE